MVYDSVILGAGPAGITAAVYLVRKGLKVLVVSVDVGGQTLISGSIENYTGFSFVTGADLSLKFREHMKLSGAYLREFERAEKIVREDELFVVKTEKDEYKAKTVVVATGKRSRELGVKGENKFKNKGITYCVTCDGPLFKNKEVCVVGGGNSALEGIIELRRLASKVYVVNSGLEFTGDKVLIDKVYGFDNVRIYHDAAIDEVYGSEYLEGIKIRHNNESVDIKVKGLFVEIGLVPNSGFLDIVKKNEFNEIVVDKHNGTDIAGIFAAGDVTDVPEKQIIVACGEGAKAALSVFKYLFSNNKLSY